MLRSIALQSVTFARTRVKRYRKCTLVEWPGVSIAALRTRQRSEIVRAVPSSKCSVPSAFFFYRTSARLQRTLLSQTFHDRMTRTRISRRYRTRRRRPCCESRRRGAHHDSRRERYARRRRDASIVLDAFIAVFSPRPAKDIRSRSAAFPGPRGDVTSPLLRTLRLCYEL
jgi:hypothetical protein